MLITGLGWLFSISGVVIGALAVGGVAGVSGVLDTVGALGLGPGMFLVTGIVLVVLGSIRTQSQQRARHDELHLGRIERALERLSTREVPTAAPSAPQTDDARIDHALLALERQDEKLANLTRATKMYGKPLIDITKQVAELADQLNEVSGATAGFGELAERLDRIDARIEGFDGGGLDEQSAERLAEILAAERRTIASIEGLQRALEERLDGARKHALEAAEAARRVEQALREVDGRITTSFDEQRQSGRRQTEEVLGAVRQAREATTGLGEQVESQRKSLVESVEQQRQTLAESVEEQRKTLAESVESLRQSLHGLDQAGSDTAALQSLEETVAAIRREVGGVATQVARLEARPATAAATPAATPAAAPAAAAPAATAPAGGGTPGGPGDGVAQKIAGARKAGGQNVLGAIAKLRSMKG